MATGKLELEDRLVTKTEDNANVTNVELCICSEPGEEPFYDLIFYFLKDDKIEFSVKHDEKLSAKELAIARKNADEKIRAFTLAIRDYYNKKGDLRNAIKFFNPSLSTFEKVILEEPSQIIKYLAYKAHWFYSLKIGVEPMHLGYYYHKIKAINERVARELTDALETTEKELTKFESIIPTLKTEPTIKIKDKLGRKQKQKTKVKLEKYLVRPHFLSPSLSFNNVAMPVAFSLVVYGGICAKEYFNLKNIEKRITETKMECQDIMTIKKIMPLAKSIEGKTFYVTEADSIKPGTYNLIRFVDQGIVDLLGERTKSLLTSVSFNVEKLEKPFSPPLCYKNIAPFGVKRNLGGARDVHSGIDFSGPSNEIIAPAHGIVNDLSYDHISGKYIIIKHGVVRATEKGLEVDLINGEKYIINVKSLRCIDPRVNRNKVVTKPIDFFDGGSLYSLYCHCKNRLVEVGDTVRRGDTIAIKGNTGRVILVELRDKNGRVRMYKPPHLHFGVRIGKIYVDPMYFITENSSNYSNLGDNSNLGDIQYALNSTLNEIKFYFR